MNIWNSYVSFMTSLYYIIDSCAYNANPSPCEDSTVGWFFNSETEQCQFGGCEGRGNIFTSMAECVKSCGKLHKYIP